MKIYKWLTNVRLEQEGISIPRTLILTKEPTLTERSLPVARLSTQALAHRLSFPMVLKPIRGRGSQFKHSTKFWSGDVGRAIHRWT